MGCGIQDVATTLPGGTAASFLAAAGQEAQKPPGRLWAMGNLLPVLLFNPEFPQPAPVTSDFVMMPEGLILLKSPSYCRASSVYRTTELSWCDFRDRTAEEQAGR